MMSSTNKQKILEICNNDQIKSEDALVQIKSILSGPLTLKSVNDLLEMETFFNIPAYQRGYRWQEQQVLDLLNDINDYANDNSSDKAEFYCLQPIVLQKMADNVYDVIDGQQRLTTIYLILKYLNNEKQITLSYQTRDDKENNESNKYFLKIIKEDSKHTNIDQFHFVRAYKTINDWFKDNEGSKVKDTLLDETQVIWYEVEDKEQGKSLKNSIDAFMRLNSGKIPLTNSEMIRASFLLKCADKETGQELKIMKQQKLSSEWDNLERELQNDDFWEFITLNNPFKKEYSNRIEFLFDLIEDGTVKDHHDKYSTYRMYENWLNGKINIKNEDKNNDEKMADAKIALENHKTVEQCWQEIKQLYYRFHEWYIDNDLYHMLGYCWSTQSTKYAEINYALNVASSKKQSELVKDIKTAIKDSFLGKDFKGIKNAIESLNYGDNKVKQLLLLFNVVTIINANNAAKHENSNSSSFTRFRFKDYIDYKWDIEHINSQTEIPKNKNIFLREICYYFGMKKLDKDESISSEKFESKKLDKLDDKAQWIIKDIVDYVTNPSKEHFETLYTQIIDCFKPKDEENVKIQTNTNKANINSNDSMNNLTLLSSKINRSYGNLPFSVKRQIIIEAEKNGEFIPPCTKNIFTKQYSTNIKDMMFWYKEDASDYLKAMIESIDEFFTNKEGE